MRMEFRLRIDEKSELRLLEEQHAPELWKLTDQNRTYLRQWLPWLDHINSLNDTLAFIKKSQEQFANNNGFQAGIGLENSIVGVVGYHEMDWENRTTSIGYWIAAACQGRGLATNACRILVNHAFTELKLNRVEIACATDNIKSQAIPRRLGFHQEGVIRQAEWLYDRYVDHVLYGILAGEWKQTSFIERSI